jgi:cobalt-zinc-cadmium efflux system membrane fusion protein
VHLVGTSIETNRTVKVHGHLEDDANHNFLSGMFVNADIIVDTHLAKALPSTSVVFIDDIAYVLMLDKKEGDTYYFIQQQVVVKNTYNEFTEIAPMNIFDANTQFLTKGVFNLLGD